MSGQQTSIVHAHTSYPTVLRGNNIRSHLFTGVLEAQKELQAIAKMQREENKQPKQSVSYISIYIRN